jgi:sugar phosphate isomerase/epimerase
MQFGVCGGPDVAVVAAEAGYGFLESTVAALLKPRESEDQFRSALAAYRAAPIPCPVVNCFVPKDLKITGPDVDEAALLDYARTVFERGKAAGVEVVVFGSGGARSIPEGFDRGEAGRQLLSFCRGIAPLAAENGVTVVVEPLYKKACNVLNTVAECAELVRAVDHPAVRLLVDGFHLLHDGDSIPSIVENGELFRHVHLATPENRLAPGAEPCDWAPFFSALRDGGYDGRVSVEAKLNDPATELPTALALMRELAS